MTMWCKRVVRLTDADIHVMCDEYYDKLVLEGAVQDNETSYGLVVACYADGLRRGQREEP